ncbi:cation diffusion facilitator family transporter [Acuticoccus sp. I52.16.1]|uniref:cation diffusion facilitator family transporter n=1 Tax=Acuticoccus sp. I52.16.1 TaxID=2928472 RepID=UPI001FD297D1|nr:cation diffusion facilitator family transporter [Acuticoccus sp. I52.16.1]UOM36351.1 cation diffusion facilitator family transporter [Acuticoccus sp. I52.16.1]
MGHDHHHHAHGASDAGDARITGAIAVNVLLTVAQIAGGLVSGSLALIADGLHNLSDAASLIIAFVARRIGRRGSDATMTFGYRRIEIVAALVNYTTLIVLGLYLAGQAVERFFDPQPIDGWMVVWIAGFALVVDVVTALLTFALAKESMNIRAAFLHNVADALGSVGVIVAGTLVILFGWWVIDPIVTLAISGYILWMSFAEIGGVIRILMLGSPPGIATEDVLAAVRTVDGVDNVHRARFWQVHEEAYAFDAHIVVLGGAWGEADAIKTRVKTLLADRFEIHQSTLELECAAHACDPAPTIGT